MDEYIKNINDKIYQNKQLIIEAFVAFYGENKRKFIEYKINNMIFIPFVNNGKSVKNDDKTIEKLFNEYYENVLNILSASNARNIIDTLDKKTVQKLYLGDTQVVSLFSLAFSKRSYDTLKEPSDYPEYIEHYITLRMKFFNFLGFNVSKQDCINIPDHLKKYILDADTMAQLDYSRFMFTIKAHGNVSSNEISRVSDIINKHGIISPDLYEIFLTRSFSGEFVPIFINGDNDINKHSLIYLSIPIDYDFSTFDETLIHEINHAIENYVFNISSSNLSTISGFSTINKNYGTTYNVINRYLNEIINDLIAQDITKIMHDGGKYVLSSENNAIIKHSSYNILSELIEPFYIMYKQDIIKSRQNNNIEHIYNVVGLENFCDLSKLCSDYMKVFNTGNYKSYIDLLSNPNNKKYVYLHDEFIKRRDEILENMKNYRNKITI